MQWWGCYYPVEMTEMQGDEAHILRPYPRGARLAESKYLPRPHSDVLQQRVSLLSA
jgi:hypothetical protein